MRFQSLKVVKDLAVEDNLSQLGLLGDAFLEMTEMHAHLNGEAVMEINESRIDSKLISKDYTITLAGKTYRRILSHAN